MESSIQNERVINLLQNGVSFTGGRHSDSSEAPSFTNGSPTIVFSMDTTEQQFFKDLGTVLSHLNHSIYHGRAPISGQIVRSQLIHQLYAISNSLKDLNKTLGLDMQNVIKCADTASANSVDTSKFLTFLENILADPQHRYTGKTPLNLAQKVQIDNASSNFSQFITDLTSGLDSSDKLQKLLTACLVDVLSSLNQASSSSNRSYFSRWESQLDAYIKGTDPLGDNVLISYAKNIVYGMQNVIQKGNICQIIENLVSLLDTQYLLPSGRIDLQSAHTIIQKVKDYLDTVIDYSQFPEEETIENNSFYVLLSEHPYGIDKTALDHDIADGLTKDCIPALTQNASLNVQDSNIIKKGSDFYNQLQAAMKTGATADSKQSAAAIAYVLLANNTVSGIPDVENSLLQQALQDLSQKQQDPELSKDITEVFNALYTKHDKEGNLAEILEKFCGFFPDSTAKISRNVVYDLIEFLNNDLLKDANGLDANEDVKKAEAELRSSLKDPASVSQFKAFLGILENIPAVDQANVDLTFSQDLMQKQLKGLLFDPTKQNPDHLQALAIFAYMVVSEYVNKEHMSHGEVKKDILDDLTNLSKPKVFTSQFDLTNALRKLYRDLYPSKTGNVVSILSNAIDMLTKSGQTTMKQTSVLDFLNGLLESELFKDAKLDTQKDVSSLIDHFKSSMKNPVQISDLEGLFQNLENLPDVRSANVDLSFKGDLMQNQLKSLLHPPIKGDPESTALFAYMVVDQYVKQPNVKNKSKIEADLSNIEKNFTNPVLALRTLYEDLYEGKTGNLDNIIDNLEYIYQHHTTPKSGWTAQNSLRLLQTLINEMPNSSDKNKAKKLITDAMPRATAATIITTLQQIAVLPAVHSANVSINHLIQNNLYKSAVSGLYQLKQTGRKSSQNAYMSAIVLAIALFRNNPKYANLSKFIQQKTPEKLISDANQALSGSGSEATKDVSTIIHAFWKENNLANMLDNLAKLPSGVDKKHVAKLLVEQILGSNKIPGLSDFALGNYKSVFQIIENHPELFKEPISLQPYLKTNGPLNKFYLNSMQFATSSSTEDMANLFYVFLGNGNDQVFRSELDPNTFNTLNNYIKDCNKNPANQKDVEGLAKFLWGSHGQIIPIPTVDPGTLPVTINTSDLFNNLLRYVHSYEGRKLSGSEEKALVQNIVHLLTTQFGNQNSILGQMGILEQPFTGLTSLQGLQNVLEQDSKLTATNVSVSLGDLLCQNCFQNSGFNWDNTSFMRAHEMLLSSIVASMTDKTKEKSVQGSILAFQASFESITYAEESNASTPYQQMMQSEYDKYLLQLIDTLEHSS